uniref:Fatty acid hydroxylase domain-containing protein n=1 Tax=Alexandrium monilatum TaxID=311494 RepID=A0A7S4SMG9_9DINO
MLPDASLVFSDPLFAQWVASYLAFLGTYWVSGLAILALPSWLRPRKIQPDVRLSGADLLAIARPTLLCHLTMYPVGFLVFWPLARRRLDFGAPPPTAAATLLAMLQLVALTEVFFYYGHRSLHSPTLYRLVHKRHHEWKAPVSIAALYFHPLEHCVTLFDALMPSLLLGLHPDTHRLWVCLSTLGVVLHHSGLEWPLDSLPPFESMVVQHDLHHKYTSCNYGVLGVLDWLHGTGRRRKAPEDGR